MLFRMGFRPFFLLASLQALLGMVLWTDWLGFSFRDRPLLEVLPISLPPIAWHAHEQLFGFVSAALAGFLLTAVPNWTGTAPIQGRPLVALVLLWIAGRVAIGCSAWMPPAVTAGIDSLFLPALLAVTARPILRARKPHNYTVLALVLLLGLANLADHLVMGGWWTLEASRVHVVTLDIILLFLILIGGRITPAFSRNWLARGGGSTERIGSPAWLGPATFAGASIVLIADAAALPDWGRGGAALLVAGLSLARLVSWRGWRIAREPLLWVLHLGGAWIPIGFALRGAALLGGGLAESTALHAHLIGAVGTLILGVMGRASLGHSGRPLAAGLALVGTYVLISGATVVRALGPWALPTLQSEAILLAGILWIGAFGLFLWMLIPLLFSGNKT